MPRLILGLMSGTSVDAIDAALVEIRGRAPALKARTLAHTESPWKPALRKRLLAAMAPAAITTQELCRLNVDVAYAFSDAALACLRTAKVAPRDVTAIASHGQTICHLPPTPGSPMGSTLQIGDASVIATLTGIATVGNFRPADMALGGQGAPLVPWADAALLRHPARRRCIQNIGGIANVTYLPPRHEDAPVIAFDTGPGNMLIDALIGIITRNRQRYDANGARAARGAVCFPLFRALQSHPYFTQPPPKSTGRELFGKQAAAKIVNDFKQVPPNDLLATATFLTAWSIADAYVHYLPRLPHEVVLCGGGADNPTLVAMLTQCLTDLQPEKPILISRIDDHGIPNKAKEAASFALLAAATLDRMPANVPSVTGASRPALLGQITPILRR